MAESPLEKGRNPEILEFKFPNTLSLERIREIQSKFVADRNWDQFHTPRNVLLAMVGEVGELSELFQWKGEVLRGLPGWTDKERKALEHELSDVLIYLVRLAELCHVDLPSAALDKIEHNKIKYPVEKVYGSSKKYNEYEPDDNECEGDNLKSNGSVGQ